MNPNTAQLTGINNSTAVFCIKINNTNIQLSGTSSPPMIYQQAFKLALSLAARLK